MRFLAVLFFAFLLPVLAFSSQPLALAATPPATGLAVKTEAGVTAVDRKKFEERGRALEEAKFHQRDRNRALFFAGVFLLLAGRAITLRESTRKLAHFWLVINALTACLVGSLCVNALFLGSLFFDDPHASYSKYLYRWGSPLLVSICAYFFARNKLGQKEYLHSARISLSYVAFVNLLIILLVLSPQ